MQDQEITRMSPDVNRVILRLPPAQKFDVLAGQYIDLIGPKGLGVATGS